MTYSDSNAITIDGFTYSKDMATVLMVDKSIATLDKMQRGVRYIGKGAFAGCKNLRIVHLPETVIWIEDFAFCDCCNIQELYLHYDIEYISPLAFTFSEEVNGRFYNCNFKTYFPNETFLKYAYMIPQLVSEERYADYGFTSNDLEDTEGWDYLTGIPIYIGEDELYRITIEDYIIRKYSANGHIEFDSNLRTEDVRKIYQIVLHDVFCKCAKEVTLIKVDESFLSHHSDEEIEFVISYFITNWAKHSPNTRPIELLRSMVCYFGRLGFSDATETEIEMQVSSIQSDLFSVDSRKLLDDYFAQYSASGYHINTQLLKSIVRESMMLMYHIGYRLGCVHKKNIT